MLTWLGNMSGRIRINIFSVNKSKIKFIWKCINKQLLLIFSLIDKTQKSSLDLLFQYNIGAFASTDTTHQ